ncbi:hypothetical protein R3P38DRAFT_3040240 [Favolaschia claudopus]|uniref:F-box domain-containing protein n=1 Tax=Favolaschia claudopus TaxID=2862362 RepID=A0AAW0A9R1_9AGAR
MPALTLAAREGRSRVVEDQIFHMKLALRKYSARRCPASRLPVELWDMIFEECVFSRAAEPNVTEAPLNVSQVCRRWRSIALSNPVLWATFALSTTERHTQSDRALQSIHKICQLWLLRAENRPLSVSLTQAEGFCCDNDSGVGPISLLLDDVLSYSTRLRQLSVRAPEVCLFPLESPNLYLPVLEHLKIESPWHSRVAPDLIMSADMAPRLRRVSILQTSFDTAHIGLDYTQLTHLTLVPAPTAPAHVFWAADDALTFLTEAPLIQVIHLAINDFTPIRRTLAQSDSLLSLSLEFRDALSGAPRRFLRIGAFFSLLYTPNLRHLSLCDRGAADRVLWPMQQYLIKWPQDQFLAYLRSTQLRALALEHLPLYETQVIECLQQVPKLVELVLEALPHTGSQRNVGDILLGALTSWNVPPNGVPIAPALRSLEFRHCGKRCTEQALILMVDSRKGVLKYLRVHRSTLPSRELAECMALWNVAVDVYY